MEYAREARFWVESPAVIDWLTTEGKVVGMTITERETQQIDEAQKYVVERIKERPVVATLAGLGVGLLLGLMMASRSDK